MLLEVITTEIDEGIDENGTVLPGIGNFGDSWTSCWKGEETTKEMSNKINHSQHLFVCQTQTATHKQKQLCSNDNKNVWSMDSS